MLRKLAIAVSISMLINVESKTTKPIKPSKEDGEKANSDVPSNLKLEEQNKNPAVNESSTINSVNVTERPVLPTFPYPLGTLDPVTNNKTADLIKMINKIDVKQIVPLVIASGPKKESHPVLRNRRSFRRRRPYGKIYRIQSRPPDLRIRPKNRLINGVKKGKPYGLKSQTQLPVGLINRDKDVGKFVKRSNDRDSLVFMLQPQLTVNDDEIIRTHAISNPEVIENYINRRRRSHHKKKKPRSTSSESSDSDLDFRTNAHRRKGYPADRDYGQLTMRAESGEEVADKINYDEKSDDYVMTTKKGVWDYEHENWAVVTKRYDWSNESNESSEGNDGNERDKQSSDNERMNILKHIDEEHKRFELQKHKHWGEPDAVAKVESILKDKGVGKEHKKDRNEWVSKNEYKETNNIKSDSEIQKIKQYNSNKNENENWQRDENEQKPPDYSNKHYRDQSKRNHKDRNKSGSHHFEDESRDKERQHEGRQDGSDVEEKLGKIDRLVGDYMDKKRQQHKEDMQETHNNKRYDSDSRENHKNQDGSGEKNRYRDERPNRDEANDRHESKEISRHRDRERRQSKERIALRSRENDEDVEKKRHKKSQLRHIETVKDWGTAKMVDWGHHRSKEDLRSNKRGWGHHRINEEDISRNNERYKFDTRQSQTQKKVEKKNDKKKANTGDKYEDFWNRHAHNDWDKVGVNWGMNKKEHKAYKERIPIPVKTTGSKDVWDRHGNNEWDKIGRYEDYKDRMSYDVKPQSHRSQNSGDPVYFGYVHTSLPFKGKKTIFDD